MTQKNNHTNCQHYLLVKVLMIFTKIPRFQCILENNILTLLVQVLIWTFLIRSVPPSFFKDLGIEKCQILEKHIFSDAKAENDLSFEGLSSCNYPKSWVNYNISYFFVYFQKINTNVQFLLIFFYSDYINIREQSGYYLQFTTPDLLSRNVVFI